MTDEELITQFEKKTLPPGQFDHSQHVRLAWVYLKRLPVLGAIERFSSGLKAYAASLGKAGLYHETVTWGYIFLIHERMARCGVEKNWEDFAAENPDLLRWKDGAFMGYYGEGVLTCDVARRVFVLPGLGVPSPKSKVQRRTARATSEGAPGKKPPASILRQAARPAG